MNTLNEEKKLLRAKAKNYCKNLSAEEKILKDRMITELLLNSDVFRGSDNILLYYSLPFEINTKSIIDYCLEFGKTVSLPVCSENSTMEFYTIKNTDSLLKGAYNIPEPDINKCSKAEIDCNTLCIVPGFCFSSDGLRLGKGGGYYDRYLAGKKIITVGLCYEELFFDTLPCDEFDIPVNFTITENKIYDFENN